MLAVIALLFVTSATNAALLTSPQWRSAIVPGTPAGYTVWDLYISFDEQLFGQQMVVELTSGSIYQNASFGTETAPTDALIPIFPEVASDSFVTMGGFTSGTSSSVLVVGGSTEIAGKNGPKKFDTQGVNIAWAPAPGVVINGGDDFPVARLTFSNDARGTIYFFSNAGGTGQIFEGQVPPLPEPTTAALVGLGLLAAATRRRA
ncbi:PEP-CTERM sorting domain-containing protein [Botrimarina mediterranea]|nr:PEP-CTERM sorting domain-containing protein [Botrimarina mediterranea]